MITNHIFQTVATGAKFHLEPDGGSVEVQNLPFPPHNERTFLMIAEDTKLPICDSEGIAVHTTLADILNAPEKYTHLPQSV